jgi:hypothetical protein
MAALANPLLFLNLNSEMLFVIDERLKSLQTTPDHAIPMLSDIIDGMFEKSWVDSMFKPKSLPPLPSVYATFARFANINTMALSASRYVYSIVVLRVILSAMAAGATPQGSCVSAAWIDCLTSCAVV